MKLFYFMILLSLTISAKAQDDFKAQQLKFDRVKTAYKEKWTDLKKILKHDGFGDRFSMVINAYKTEGKLEIWLKNNTDKKYTLFRTYDFCAHSGTIGPKVIEGDGQTPEGFYYVNVFNPMSNFHLSLGVNYPNNVDYARTGKDKKPGGDIYIHGNCVTVGCIPLTDEKIKEVYVLGVEARNAGQERIPVNIYPFKMTDANLKKYSVQFPKQVNFWKTLQQGYNAFQKNKSFSEVKEVKGKYIVK
ncbi:L,D-transpeptidase family protein [Pedobacter punctiformis]|uniref:L,D-transpeptidase family protein n=1 Tax=Pedobacter punctiformis TaxID=3004097 RepID=A0ABT4LCE4_9SPHI|nr:L,D-transpeptidase family protein [Pedobacter sp. HCMS5-2]MCZ4245585.1 L,D-transpeptidase family protein [Pedobacter sp. HCMS5-2]